MCSTQHITEALKQFITSQIPHSSTAAIHILNLLDHLWLEFPNLLNSGCYSDSAKRAEEKRRAFKAISRPWWYSMRSDISREPENNTCTYYAETHNNDRESQEASKELKQIITTLHACLVTPHLKERLSDKVLPGEPERLISSLGTLSLVCCFTDAYRSIFPAWLWRAVRGVMIRTMIHWSFNLSIYHPSTNPYSCMQSMTAGWIVLTNTHRCWVHL